MLVWVSDTKLVRVETVQGIETCDVCVKPFEDTECIMQCSATPFPLEESLK
jgi:hypothetical protein